VKGKRLIVQVTEAEFKDHCEGDDGICLACGEWQEGGVEPDAEKYVCEACEKPAVYGCEQALIIGRLDLVDEPESTPEKDTAAIVDWIDPLSQ
jgi:hypothetical protein